MTDNSRPASVREASETFAQALARHTEAVLADGAGSDAEESAFEELTEAQVAYFQAVDPWDEEDDEQEPPPEGRTISVVRRGDYVVTDLDAVLASGRAAYLELWPDDSETDAADDVEGLGRALYQVAHAGGWDSLLELEGLSPVGGITLVVSQDEPLDEDPDTWLEQLGIDEDELLYAQSDVWG